MLRQQFAREVKWPDRAKVRNRIYIPLSDSDGEGWYLMWWYIRFLAALVLVFRVAAVVFQVLPSLRRRFNNASSSGVQKRRLTRVDGLMMFLWWARSAFSHAAGVLPNCLAAC